MYCVYLSQAIKLIANIYKQKHIINITIENDTALVLFAVAHLSTNRLCAIKDLK